MKIISISENSEGYKNHNLLIHLYNKHNYKIYAFYIYIYINRNYFLTLLLNSINCAISSWKKYNLWNKYNIYSVKSNTLGISIFLFYH